MKNLSKIVLGVCSIATGSLFAENNCSAWNPYVEVKGMAMKPESLLGELIKFKWGYGGALEVGTRYEDWRIGFELGYATAKLKTLHGNFDFFDPIWGVRVQGNGTITSKTNYFYGMINCCHDFKLNDAFDFYAGLGGGLTDAKRKASLSGNVNVDGAPLVGGELKSSSSSTRFTWQVMAGITYHINENWGIKTGYRFFKIQHKDLSDIHCLELGLRYNF